MLAVFLILAKNLFWKTEQMNSRFLVAYWHYLSKVVFRLLNHGSQPAVFLNISFHFLSEVLTNNLFMMQNYFSSTDTVQCRINLNWSMCTNIFPRFETVYFSILVYTSFEILCPFLLSMKRFVNCRALSICYLN